MWEFNIWQRKLFQSSEKNKGLTQNWNNQNINYGGFLMEKET